MLLEIRNISRQNDLAPESVNFNYLKWKICKYGHFSRSFDPLISILNIEKPVH